MDFNETGLGIDMEENSRFANKTLSGDADFLNKIFSKVELDYCFSKTSPARHLCARFAAKEATMKALGSLTGSKPICSQVEVVNDDSGAPLLNIDEQFGVEGKVSLSHTDTHSIAIVIIKKK